MQEHFHPDHANLQQEWNTLGEDYARQVNEMVEFGEKHGWDKWKGKDPEDKRDHLAPDVLQLLRQANLEHRVEAFRSAYPPAYLPFIPMMKAKGQNLEQLHVIDEDKIVFLTGAPYERRQAHLLHHDQVIPLDEAIQAVGKAMRGSVFAIATAAEITTFQTWEGTPIQHFPRSASVGLGITQLIPFNDGRRLLIVTSSGIFLATDQGEQLIHPLQEDYEDEDMEEEDEEQMEEDEMEEDEDEEWSTRMSMENATLSHDNRYIVVGDQGRDHRVLDAEGNRLTTIGSQSSYPHFCLFSKDDSQLISNSCHFYNGITIGVDTARLPEVKVPSYQESDTYVVIESGMRVYAGVATQSCYILGDAYGYIRALDKNGNRLWRHYLGSTVTGMALSQDEQTLWVGCHSGILHKLRLGQGHRDTHTMGNGNHFEEYRLLIWKDEPQIWRW